MNLLLFRMKNQSGEKGLRDNGKSGSAPPIKKSLTLRSKQDIKVNAEALVQQKIAWEEMISKAE